MSSRWTHKPDGAISCENATPCHPPSVCWWPEDYSRPTICAPPDINMNRIQEGQRFVIASSFAVLLTTLVFLAGFLLALIIAIVISAIRHRRRLLKDHVPTGTSAGIFEPFRRFSFRRQRPRDATPSAFQSSPLLVDVASSTGRSGTQFEEIPLHPVPCTSRSHYRT